MKVAQTCPTLCDPMRYGNSPGQNTGEGVLCLLQVIIEPRSPTLQADSLPAKLQGSLGPLRRIKESEALKEEKRTFISTLLCLQFSSVAQLCPTLCDPMNRSTPGLPLHHQLPEFTQAHVHRVGDAIQPSHPLSSPSPPAPNPSQHQGLFK